MLGVSFTSEKMSTEMRRMTRWKTMRVLLSKYNLEEDADKLGTGLQTIRGIGMIDQDIVNKYKLQGTVAQYMDIFKQETGKYPAGYSGFLNVTPEFSPFHFFPFLPEKWKKVERRKLRG